MAKASVAFEGTEPDNLACQVSSLWERWDDGRLPWKKRVAETIQYIYATSTRETGNNANPWSHSTVIPKLTQIHDNLGANYSSALFASRDFFTFEPGMPDEASEGQRAAIIAYLTTKHDQSGFFHVMGKALDDWVQTGNCFVRLEYVREVDEDPLTGNPFTLYEGPKLFRVSPYDIVFDPTIARFEDSPKIIRELITRGEFMRRVEDSPEGQVYIQEGVNKVNAIRRAATGVETEDLHKSVQLQMDGFTSAYDYFTSGKVELLHFMGDIFDEATGELHRSRVITVADRRYVVRNDMLGDLQGFGQIYHCGWRPRPDNLWAQGPLDNLVGMQYLINHLENARADGFDQMLSPDRVHIGTVEIESKGPVRNYYVDQGGDVRNLSPDPTVLNADTQIQYKEAQMEAYAGAPRETMGIRSAGEKTAFEVQNLATAASRMFQTRLNQFDMSFIEPIIQGELQVAVQNLSGYDVAKVLDDDFGVEMFLNISPEDLNIRGKLKARGAQHFAKRAQLVQELTQFGQILAGDPEMKVHFPPKARAKLWNDTLGLTKYGLFLPFGAIDEESEKAEYLSASQNQLAEFDAANQEGDATDEPIPQA